MGFRIVSFDGGGIRGVLSATLIDRISQHRPDLIPKADLLAGTSTGAFIALGLAYGLSPQQIRDLYSEVNLERIFNSKYRGFFRPKYNNSRLRMLLASVFPSNLRLGDLRSNVVIPSFMIRSTKGGSWKPVFFNNFPGSNTIDERVIDVALASSAAPVFFPSYHDCIDGGVVANNPAIAAVCSSVDPRLGNQDIRDLCLLSIGTGAVSVAIQEDTSKWGGYQWMDGKASPSRPLMAVLFDGIVQVSGEYTKSLLGKRYFRLNPALQKGVPLDDHQVVTEIAELGEQVDLRRTLGWIKRYWSSAA